jgi:hypothetical protein
MYDKTQHLLQLQTRQLSPHRETFRHILLTAVKATHDQPHQHYPKQSLVSLLNYITKGTGSQK